MDFCFRGVVWIIEDRNRSGDCLRITLEGMTLKFYRFLLLCPKSDSHYATGEEIVTYSCWSNLIDVTDTSFRGCCFSEKRSCDQQGNQPYQENGWAPNEHRAKSETSSLRPCGTKPSLGIRGSVVPWGQWLPSEGE